MDKETGLFHFLMLVISLVVLCESRVVKVPTGPLMHVEGQAVSIHCDVSDYEGPSDQDFDWSMVLSGDKLVNIISTTFDSGFTDSSVKDRVNSGDISINKLGHSSVELRFKKVRATDSGLYRCSTPSTDSVVSGNYDADVELKVIGDSLKVATAVSKSVVNEGESVQLQCSITRGFTEHTFLSVTWSIRRGNNPFEEILTFGPDDEIKVESNYSQLYADGGFQLDLRGGGFYGLVLTNPKPMEVGVYVCTAREWVRQGEEGKKWRKILERTEEVGKVVVTPIAQSLMVAVEKNTTLNVGDTLNLTCTVAANVLPSLSLELMWLVRSIDGSGSPRVLIHIGRDGLLQNGSEAVGFSKVNARTFRLLVHKVDRSDSGLYSCRVKAWLQQGREKWYQAAEKTSDTVQVLVTHLEPQFKVTLEAPLTPQFTSDPTELRCQVTNLLHLQDGLLGVTWSYSNTTKDASQNEVIIASLNQHGALTTGRQYKERLERGDIAVTKRDPNIFILRMLQTRDTDMGSYLCSVTAWTSGRQGGWEKAKDVPSTSVVVQWSPKVPVLQVLAHRVREASTGGSTFEMTCRVTAQNLQNPAYSVLILFEETRGGKSRKVLSLSSDSVLQLEEWSEPNRMDSVVLEKTGQLEYRFRLYGAQVSDCGFYYCRVTAWMSDQGTDWNQAVNESNKIEIAFADTGPVFNISIQSHTSKVLPGDTVKMKCIMSTLSAAPNTGDVAFDIRWFQSSERAVDNGGVLPLISMDRWGVVKKTGGDRTQCSLERTDWQTFVLGVHKTEDNDVGEYYCTATPWLLSPATGVWTKGQDLKSAPVFLSIKLELLDSLKMPVSYGVAAAVIACLLSVLLGLGVSHCCFSKNPMHTPRPRNKLIDLEMD
ncbi:prostaglandin F2 receptor negative regulator-like [Triplophysa rosa]|uniref:Prostaglandin F2 receptor negative regulator-like n=1 Tax=Triplophysa rosa TaxID=992332 RepID=A0A9W8C6U5_TRIRA|nr:prostaglandin F2 receptor negative regulator-like [Triplophysa rosa]KAI7809095.1 putative prostaglandin F2 receptor negative regulator-like [Triplophysa rosa]